MVFGVFDGLHPGHRAFLRQARRYGKELIVVVARDSAVRKLKNKKPRQGEKERLKAVCKVNGVTQAVLGDRRQSSYTVIKKYKPDVVCLGYDQGWLEEDLKRRMSRKLVPRVLLMRLKPYHPERFKSSKLNPVTKISTTWAKPHNLIRRWMNTS